MTYHDWLDDGTASKPEDTNATSSSGTAPSTVAPDAVIALFHTLTPTAQATVLAGIAPRQNSDKVGEQNAR
jgi:hypothetical protein